MNLNAHRTMQLYGALLLLPAALLLTAFAYLPTVTTVINSLFLPGFRGEPAAFVGLDNYRVLMDDPTFWKVARNNLLYALGTVPTSMALALGMALLVNARLPGRGLVRMAYFTPTILPMIAAANIWMFFYAPQIGLFNKLLGALGFAGVNWLGDPGVALGSVIVMSVWKEAGFFMIFYLAALQAIPPELKEAADLEGTSRWSFFWRVTFPLLMPTTLFVLINALINAVRVVDHLFILTKGGPNNATNLLLYYVYENAFSFFDRTMAATITVVILLVLAVVATLKFTILDRRTHYQ
ncbi:sugar ABC transporter permease [Halomonas sp. 141]|uniref:ABC transporter permease n=1 Tax=Vreelandella hamiltonii TaxID=502829 RepID=A0A8H9LZR4_9GAMM|nr:MULTISPECIES: sugar ABC transporter permease [Halomonas]ATH77574.1 ABC transporter permease [Halomonas hydrothermalis]PJX14400.1 sugar ABC transporter permease [Halomonas sp. 141]UDM06833.1 sugar ABC transporter permease [Halomonas sp. NyZ770]GGW26024.1 ABC transporter permease [Halomonas hamiltonii]